MGIFDFFKKKKQKSGYDALMDIPGFKETKLAFDLMSPLTAGGCTTDEMPFVSRQYLRQFDLE